MMLGAKKEFSAWSFILGLCSGLFILWFKQSQVFHLPSKKFREVKRFIVICLQTKTSCGN